MRRIVALVRRHPRDAVLVGMLALTVIRFAWVQLRMELRPDVVRAWTFLAGGSDYEAARWRDGFTTLGEDHRIVSGVDRILPDGATAVALGPWVFQRHCRYYLYPRRIINHGYAAGPTFEEVFRSSPRDAVIVREPALLDPSSPLLDPARFEARPVEGTTAVVYVDRNSPRRDGAAPPRPEGARWPFQAVPEAGPGVIARVLAALVAFLLVGIAVAGAESLALAFLAGSGVFAVAVVLMTWMRVPLDGWSFAALALAGLAGAAWRLRREGAGDWRARGWTALVTALPVATAALLALGAPMDSGDDLSHWAMRAKVYFAIGAVDTPGAAQGAFVVNYYPPLVSTSLAWIYVAVGGVADGPAKLFFPAILAAVLGALAHALGKAGLSLPRALAWTAIAALSGNEMMLHGGWAWADLALAGFAIAAGAWLHRGLAEGPRALLWGSIFAGLGAFTKAEGVPTGLLLLGPVALVLLWRRKWRDLLPLAAPFAIAVAMWSLHCMAFDYPLTREHVGAFDPRRLGVAVPAVAAAFFVPWNWGVGAGAVLVGWVGATLRRIRAAAYPAAVAVGHVCFILAAYVVTATGQALQLQIGWTVQRLLLHTWPLVVYAAALGWSSQAYGPKSNASPAGRSS